MFLCAMGCGGETEMPPPGPDPVKECETFAESACRRIADCEILNIPAEVPITAEEVFQECLSGFRLENDCGLVMSFDAAKLQRCRADLVRATCFSLTDPTVRGIPASCDSVFSKAPKMSLGAGPMSKIGPRREV